MLRRLPLRPGRTILSKEYLVSYPSGRLRRRRSHRRRRHIRRAFFALAALGLLVLGVRSAPFLRAAWRSHASRAAGDSSWARGDASQNLSLLAAKSVAGPIVIPRRVVYPYSVIPGGIRTPEDLREVSEHDSVIGQHYAGFDYRNARIVEVEHPKLVYLSYRMHGKIFWSTRRVSLHVGEKLITDGTMTARVRCANRVSEAAQKGSSPEEPPAAKFEEPFLGTAEQVPPPATFVSALSPPAFPGQGVEAPPVMSYAGAPPIGGGFPPLFPPPIPSGSCAPSKKNGKAQALDMGLELSEQATNKPKPCPTPPKPPIPEPGTIVLVGSGLAGIYWRRRKGA
jgi:hypothetical protein